MNKRFSTLLATILVAGGFSFTASAFSADRAAAAVTGTSFDKTTYYHLSTGNSGFTDNILSFTTASDGTDSLYVRTNAKDGAWSSAGAAAVDSALWAIDSVAVGNLGYAYSFTNKVSGKKIALDVENEVVVLSDEAASFGWGGTIGGKLTYVAGGKTYVINKDADFITEDAAKAMSLYPYSAARVKLSADDLNAANGTYFQLAFDGTIEDNVFTNPNYKIEAVASNMSTAGPVYLRVKGAEGLKVGGNPKVKNDTLFVVVDTVKYELTGTTWEEAAGFKLALDTVHAGGGTNGSSLNAGVPVAPCNNRVAESYQFTFYRNPGSATSDSLIIAIDGLKDGTGSNGSEFVKGDGGYLSYASLNKSTKVLTTAADGKEDLPLISFKTGTKANLAEGAYFITIVKEANKANKYEGKDAICDIKGVIGYEKGAASEFMPSTQWSAKKDALGKYTFTNRDEVSGVAPVATFGSINYLYTYGDNYIYGGDTIKLTPVTTTSETVGYFNYTDEELANKAIALQFISPIGASAYVDINKDSTLYAAEMDEADAPKFKLVKAAEEEFGPDKLVRASYFLVEQFGLKRYLGLEGGVQTAADGTTSGQFKMIMGEDGATSHYADTVAVVLRATAKEGEYQIIVATPDRSAGDNGEDVYAASYTANQFQGTITGSKGLMQTVGLGTATLGTFKVVTPAAPEYLNIIDSKPSHQRLYSSANTTLAIGMGAEGEGMLKAVSELKADFAADDFKMYIDTACMEDATKPLFYILTTAGIEDAQKEEGIANYLSTASSKLAYVPASQYGLGNDSILYYDAKDFTKAPDTVKVASSKSAFAFRATDTDGEFLIEAAASGKCLAQENGILYLVNPNEKEALAFCTEAVEAPTANEGVEVSEVTVIAGEGQVTIAGAQGKKVVISNILGQTVANTVITSDNAVIAAPQGVVVVAVEGEEAVKAIVK